jgi:hypothetical protein
VLGNCIAIENGTSKRNNNLVAVTLLFFNKITPESFEYSTSDVPDPILKTKAIT